MLLAGIAGLSQKNSAAPDSKMSVRDSYRKILNILTDVRDPERTLVKDWELYAWLGESKGAWWRSRVRDPTQDNAMKHIQSSGCAVVEASEW